jgi:hypothetical protein
MIVAGGRESGLVEGVVAGGQCGVAAPDDVAAPGSEINDDDHP